MMPAVRALAEAGHASWPSAGLDVPADDAGRDHYARLRDLDRAFRDVAYRTRLAEVPGETPRQEHLIDEAVQRARRLLTA